MRKLVLIRHSESQPKEALPPAQWTLSPAGRRRCRPLAQWLAPYDPVIILSSHERKATETARRTGTLLEKPHRAVDGLGEHNRSNEPYHDQDTFLKLVEALLTHPEKEVFGNETGAEALARFEAAIGRVVEEQTRGNVAVVTHGTVLSLFVAAHSDRKPFPFWQQLRQPALVVFSLPEMRLLEVVFDASIDLSEAL